MRKSSYKSFAYQFEPLSHISLTKDIYAHVDHILENEKKYWLHFEKPSKNLQQQLAKKFSLPKSVRMILFADETRSRCVRLEQSCALVLQGIQPSMMKSDEDFPTLRLWITQNGILSLSTAKIQALHDTQQTMTHENTKKTPIFCLINLIEHLISHLEDSIYQIDEELNKVEADFEYTEEATQEIMETRQNIIYLRRYALPQRDALITLSNKLEHISDNTRLVLKELSDNMLRQVETIEMLRERAMIIQDNLTNQIGEISNKRMYFLTIIMLIFTPAFFIMGMFSMYVPIPGMNSKLTWWILILLITLISFGLFILFKKKKWL